MQITSDSKELVKAIILRAQEAVQRLFELDRMKWSVRIIDKIEALQLIASPLLQEDKWSAHMSVPYYLTLCSRVFSFHFPIYYIYNIARVKWGTKPKSSKFNIAIYMYAYKSM